jgi:nicotinate-nucleotide pyrophosphorylase (carboxylating)
MNLNEFVRLALIEDVGDGDHTSLSTIPQSAQGKARLLVKADGIIAGIDIGISIFKAVDENFTFQVFLKDGDPVKYGDEAFYVYGPSQSILKAERLVLNVMQRMSAIATKTNEIVQLLEGTKCKVLDTRKTTPLLRFIEKAAVKIGGGVNHRFGLYDMMMIKDNHIDYAGGIKQAVERANEYIEAEDLNIKIEIEARDLNELDEILSVGKVHRIMLDNFSYEDLRTAVNRIGEEYETEASGGITIETARSYAECGVDYISMGALTHSVRAFDLSLKALD